jgi:hypothetical protein
MASSLQLFATLRTSHHTGTRGAQTAEAGDFGTAVYESLKKRCARPLREPEERFEVLNLCCPLRCPEKGDMSVYDINAALDSLNAAADK